ncbi:uncharacterized protein LOC123321568 [Coccinella septempunctata]|uniref:uncharacterized protein LOC123321568 n=1 Tax=Coccinella septempunctata TaxID=41139 RepID=UPI001D05D07C|nr:uncharacterized protein LOC123321568 [Coccinella septempunctata]
MEEYTRQILQRSFESTRKLWRWCQKKAPYVYSKQLRFLKDTVTPKETTDTLKELNIESGGSTVVEERTTPSTATPTCTKRLIGKKRSNLIEEKLLCSLKTYEKRMSSDCHDNDDNRQFLLSLVPTLASLPKLSNTKCRIEILQVMSKYESCAAQQTHQQPGYIPYHIQQQPCYIPQIQQHPSYNSQQFQQQQGYTPYTHQNQMNNQNQQQPIHSADLQRINHKRSLAEQQEQSWNPEASNAAADTVQSYLSHFSGDDDSQFSIF